MAQVITQAEVRECAEAAEAASTYGDYVRAMMNLRLAFDELFVEHNPKWTGQVSEFAFGPSLGPYRLRQDEISSLLRLADSKGRHGRHADRLAQHVTKLMDIVDVLQTGMRLAVLGIDYPSYLRFTKLTPRYGITGRGKRDWRAPVGYAPDADAYGFCMQFVVTASLRLASAEAHLADPSWLSRNDFGQTSWQTVEESITDERDAGEPAS